MELRAIEAVVAQEGAVALLVLQDRDRLVGALEREPEPLGGVGGRDDAGVGGEGHDAVGADRLSGGQHGSLVDDARVHVAVGEAVGVVVGQVVARDDTGTQLVGGVDDGDGVPGPAEQQERLWHG